MTEKRTAKALILEALSDGSWKAVHELRIPAVSQNAAATRLSELAREGKVMGRVRDGKSFKEWSRVAVEANGQALFFAVEGHKNATTVTERQHG